MSNTQMRSTFALAAVSMACFMVGCAGPVQQMAAQEASDATDHIGQKHDKYRKSVTEADARRVASQDVNRPFIAGNTKPLAREVMLPEQLRKSVAVTALYQRGEVDLMTAIKQVGEASGLLITASSDALLPASAFAPRTSGAAATAGPPPRVVLPTKATPLWSLLDDIARQTQTAWRPVSTGAEFYRVETRVYQLAAIPQEASSEASLGRNGEANAIFEAKSKTSFSIDKQNKLKGIQTAVEAMLTTGGKLTIATENQTLIVTDTPASLDKVDTFVREQNKIASRRVRLMLEAIEVVDKNASDIGVDWNLIYSVTSGALGFTGPGSMASANAGAFGINQISSGRWAGSTGVVDALNEVGTVVNRRFFPLLTTSGRPVTQAIRTTFNYVDQVQATTVASSADTAQAPTVTQKEETVGTFLTMVPTAKQDGTIFLSLSYDQTSAQPLVPFTVGSADSQVTVQQKTIDGTGVIMETPIRSGHPIIVGGIEALTSQDTIRRMYNGAPMILGGGNGTKYARTRMVLLVTAVTEEGI